MKAIEKRLQELEAEQGRKDLPPIHIVQYTVRYGDDVEAKRAEAEADMSPSASIASASNAASISAVSP